jgi:Lon protease-like protein
MNVGAAESAAAEGATVVPLFPLGVTYLPYTKPVLNIFEPRYRAMYNDILFSGARRFMVCNVDGATGRLAEVGVLFYLDDLKEVSEQTGDRVKFVGSHSVIGRVRLKKVLNPKMAETRESYLRAEVEELEDEDAGEDTAAAEAEARKVFEEMVDTQARLGEEPRFTEAVKGTVNFGRGSGTDDTGLWGCVVLWQQFLEQRSNVVGNKMQREVQKIVMDFLKENKDGGKVVNERGEMRLEDLPPPLVNEIRSTQRRYQEELDAMSSDPYGLQFQALLQAPSHSSRLDIFSKIIGEEQKRLAAREQLKSMFKGVGDS